MAKEDDTNEFPKSHLNQLDSRLRSKYVRLFYLHLPFQVYPALIREVLMQHMAALIEKRASS